MSKVIEESGDGVVVFVAPTKALVNQVAAQVYKDFGGGVHGVFTRDFRHNMLTSRVLVTVPACLEILLLSAVNRDWCRRIQYVIFDEVHCLREGGVREGGVREGSGAVWEHLLLLVRCPLLALSATIGNAESFTAWLAGVKALQQQQDAARGEERDRKFYKVHGIFHSERYSDLRFFAFRAPTALPAGIGVVPLVDSVAAVNGCLLERDGARGGAGGGAAAVLQGCELLRMHPLGVLKLSDLQKGELPPELQLEPIDALQLYDAMAAAAAAAATSAAAATEGTQHGSSRVADAAWACGAEAELASLQPDTYFGEVYIKRKRAREYAHTLRALLQRWSCSDAPAAVHAAAHVLNSFTQPGHRDAPPVAPAATSGLAAADADSSGVGDAAAAPESSEGPAQCYARRNASFVSAVMALAAHDMLPLIAFSFDRKACEAMVLALQQYLEACEAQHRERHAQRYRQQAAAAAAARRAARAGRDRKPRRGGEDEGEDGEGAAAVEDVPEVLPDFTLCGKASSMSAQEVEELIEHAGQAGDALLAALRRGIGVHHSGMPKAYRQTVEILFRQRHLRVLVATGTLAYGINMPCRTVMFAGDHQWLNPLQFRQMIGRAGRRGFDLLGFVVFLNVPLRKQRGLMVSPVPYLRGNFPLDVTLVLRLLSVHAMAPQDAVLRDSLLCLLHKPMYAAGDARLAAKMKHMFQFALAYLRDIGLLDHVTLAPVGLSGIVCHLYFTSPSNLVLAHLLRCGVLARTCCDEYKPPCAAGWHTISDAVWQRLSQRLLLLLAHVFERRPLHRAALSDETIRTSPSKVILEDLPADAAVALAAYNASALAQCVAYMERALGEGQVAALPDDQALPLSAFAPAAESGQLWGDDAAAENCPLRALLRGAAVPARLCSPFAALSGHGDDFGSAEELLRCCRSGIEMDMCAMPVLSMTNRYGQVLPLNRYIVDYWAHGNKVALVQGNGLREGDAWEALSNVKSHLAAAAVALEKMAGGSIPVDVGEAGVLYCMRRLADEFKEKFKAFNGANAQQARRSGI